MTLLAVLSGLSTTILKGLNATLTLDLEFEVTDQCLGRLRIGSFRFGARRDRFGLNARGAPRGSSHARRQDRWEAIQRWSRR